MNKITQFALATVAAICLPASLYAKGGHGGGGHHGGGHHGGGHHSGAHHSGAHHSNAHKSGAHHNGDHHASHHHTGTHDHHHTGHRGGWGAGGWGGGWGGNGWGGNYGGWHGWHQGNWNNWNAWPSMWGGGNGVGTSGSNFSYNNPFWGANYAGAVNYAQPIPTGPFVNPQPNGPRQSTSIQSSGGSIAQGGGPAPQESADTDDNSADSDADSGGSDTDDADDASTDDNDDADSEDADSDDADSDDAIPEPNAQQKQALAEVEAARTAFQAGRYAEAQQSLEKAIAIWPQDVAAHEFRALALFAQHKYRESAAATYAVLVGGPGWNEATLLSFYPDRKAYDEQLRELTSFAKQHPNAAEADFLLAYHQLVAGNLDQARSHLERVAELNPQDALTAELLKALRTPKQ